MKLKGQLKMKKLERKFVMANKLLESRYNEKTTNDYKFLSVALHLVYHEDWQRKKWTPHDAFKNSEARSVSININDYVDLTNVRKDHAIEFVKEKCRKYMKDAKGVEIYEYDEVSIFGQWKVYGWFDSLGYNIDTGIITFTFASHMLQYLSNLKSNFAIINLENIMALDSPHSIRLYQLLIAHKKYGKKFNLIDFKKLMWLESKRRYKNYNTFKEEILDPCQKEINNKTEMEFFYTEIYGTTKKGQHAVTELIFDIQAKKTIKEKLKKIENEYKKPNPSGAINRLVKEDCVHVVTEIKQFLKQQDGYKKIYGENFEKTVNAE
jgi:plasmid replication initiation protein